jgi:sulfur-oxidizing protein SoxZ
MRGSTCRRRRNAARSSEIKTLVQHTAKPDFAALISGCRLRARYHQSVRVHCTTVEICRVELHPSISANPYLAFSTVANGPARLVFNWSGDNGFTATESASISVV